MVDSCDPSGGCNCIFYAQMNNSVPVVSKQVYRRTSRWMSYFLAVLGMGTAAGQEVLLDYWCVGVDEKSAGQDLTRVLRVAGDKGERYVPVYEKLHSHPLVVQARTALNTRLRNKALRLSCQYRTAGMSPKAAYERAWAEVYERFQSQVSLVEAKEALAQLAARTQAVGASVSASDAEVVRVLQMLVQHEELLETEDARTLLDYFSWQHVERESLLVNQLGPEWSNDALMVLFADAMVHGMKGANAFRDAQFKLNRERIVHHELTGYLAPWGAGMGGRISYRQAPRRKVIAATTLGSGTLKNTLPDEDEKKKQQEQEEEKKVTSTSGEAENNGPKPVYMGPPSGGGDGPMRFTMMRAAAPEAGSPEAGEISDYTYTWNGAGTNNIWSAAGSAENSAWGSQTASGNTPGIYENGNQVVFGDSATGRDVSISGVVAPGLITVNANTEPASSGTGDAILNYGYAFTGNGSIADYSDSVRTSIDVKGNALLILNTVNTFSGGITMADGASVYLGRDHAAGTGTINMGANSTLYVNYRSDDLSFRSPALSNALVIAGETAIRTGTGSYGEDRMPSDWRTLTLSGGISGSGTLSLYGYSYLIKPTQYEDRLVSFNYVSAFAINERDAVAAGGGKPSRFTGTVYLKNEFNDRPNGVQEIPVEKNKILAGALQLTLVDDVFSVATLNLTRDESTDRTAGHNQGNTGAAGKPSTSDNILVLSDNSQIRIKALEADFLGHGFKLNYRDNNASSYIPITAYISDYEQEEERWVVRVVTDGSTNLVLEDNSGAVHKFAGSMGFAHSYAAPGQSYIYAAGSSTKFSTDVLAPSNPGAGSLGVESLSLEKRGQSTQYIHTANLQDLSVLGGTAGFNYLNLSGDLNMVSGSKLQLATATNSATGWESISGTSYDSTNTVTVTGGNRVSVVTLPGGNTDPAAIAGGLTMAEGSSLNFEIQSLSPSADSSLPHLQISGALTMQYDTPVSVSITNADFAQTAGTTKYYLAGAGSLSVLDGTKNAKFQSQLIPLGYGYYGTVFVEGNYLVLTVDGDPRRTWSGMVDSPTTDTSGAPKAYEWYTTPYTAEQIKADAISMDPDKRWKENCIFQNAQVVLFGNLYEPTQWEADKSLLSSQTVIVNGSDDKLHDGTLVGETEEGKAGSQIFQIDDVSLVSLGTGEDADRTLGYQAVKISGEVAPLSVVINSKFTKVLSDGSSKLEDDDTNYFFYGDGCIADADEISLGVTDFDLDWKTNLRKTGLGTAVIATKNTYSGGTVIEGGRLVMQNIHALGKGSITMQNVSDKGVNIPVLQGDFSDTDKSTTDWAERIDSDNLSAYQGEGMDTTTIHNPVNVVLPSGIGGGVNTSRVDARIANAHDKKLVLKELKGDFGTVLTLYGTSLAEDAANHHGGMYTYAVFKVLDPSEFYGTIKMDGNLWGEAEGTQGGNVQMEIMTTAKSSTGADWLHTNVDLTVENGTTRTVLALDALGTDGADLQQTAQVDSLNGTGNSGGCMNSSVLSMSHEKKITLELEGLVAGNYDGVLGFGDFQKTVDYGKSSDVAIGAVAHHYGGRGKEGELSVRKLGNTTQSVNSAWLNRLTVGYRLAEGKEAADADGEVATAGGAFVVDEALVVSELKIADGMHTVVGQLGTSSTHALTVGAGGILAFEQTGKDAFNGIGAGIAKQTKEEINGENITIKEIAPENFVLLADGATVSAYGDWYTNRQRVESINGTSVTLEVGIDIESAATVTFNTHNFTPDAYISDDNDNFGNYKHSHVIQLLGEMKGQDVNLIFNNELISGAAQKENEAVKRADGLGYEGKTGTEMGHVAIRDIHQFTGDITVKDMTALQVNQSNTAANAEKADIEVTVSGKNGALQFVDGVTDQYINQVNLEKGGHVLFGGELQESRTGWESLDQTQVEVDIAHREGKPAGSLNNLDLVKDTADKSISLGGTDSTPTVAKNVHITTKSTQEAYNTMILLDSELQSSIMELHKACQLDITDAVLVDQNSVVRASVEAGGVVSASSSLNPVNSPMASKLGNEVITTVNTTVELTFDRSKGVLHEVGDTKIFVVQANQLQGVDLNGSGLTIEFKDNALYWARLAGADYLAVQINGGSGQFLYDDGTYAFQQKLDAGQDYVAKDMDGNVLQDTWVSSETVSADAGSATVTVNMLYFAVMVPEPSTATLSLLALTALTMRRRRK